MTSHPCFHVVACVCESLRYTVWFLWTMWAYFLFGALFRAHSTSHVSLFVSVAPGINAGTTSTVALLRDGIELVVGSVGDSRAMLCRKGKALKLTVDHTPERKDEKERYKDVVSSATSFIQSILFSIIYLYLHRLPVFSSMFGNT